ncbi:hypothetical protein C7H19_22025 [Aphanothece hegewaldii CCALA 016]|uniref:Uncharacterized protein n=1 Tax=Aphanothece hegewaldii CCALA 016 TaxID=2107694 RepID=A0A2T1LS40_9CHRO|nr:hypothetical protein [Aphanothece hegewaldii]PSF32124.1 hypothetical protein C7H19_22025 [Aphanothece hegewaldii CCALA 016]
MSSKPIYELVDELPTNNMTVTTLRALDFVVPGQWENIVGFKNTIIKVTGETDEALIQQIGDRAVWLFNDKSQGYQRALWLYQTIDDADAALATAALANKISGKIPLGGLLNRLTPNSDKAQTLDLALKLVTELVAFCQINGIPGDSIGDFVGALGEYSGESLMRMAALVCIDGLIPLGTDFIKKVESTLGVLSPADLEKNSTFGKIKPLIPGDNTQGQLAFIGESFNSTKSWMSNFVTSKSLTPETLLNRFNSFIDFSENKLDYLAAFLDITTNYFEHTGTQSLARRLIERAVAEI